MKWCLKSRFAPRPWTNAQSMDSHRIRFTRAEWADPTSTDCRNHGPFDHSRPRERYAVKEWRAAFGPFSLQLVGNGSNQARSTQPSYRDLCRLPEMMTRNTAIAKRQPWLWDWLAVALVSQGSLALSDPGAPAPAGHDHHLPPPVLSGAYGYHPMLPSKRRAMTMSCRLRSKSSSSLPESTKTSWTLAWRGW